MSRTYRRKTSKYGYQSTHWSYSRSYHSEEEFAEDYNKYKNVGPKPAPIAPPKVSLYSIWFKESDYYKRIEKEWEVWRSNYYTPEYYEHRAAVLFKIDTCGKDSLKSLNEYNEAMYHSDAGVGQYWMRHGPKWYVNCYLERPMRRATKMAIHHTIRDNANFDECDVVLDPFIKLACYYW